jgi:hypothetical protein
MIFKEDRTHYSYAEYVSGTESWDYPVKDLNEKVGNIAFGAVQVIQDSAVSITDGTWWNWLTSSVESQRSASVISEKLRNSLALIDLSTAKTFDNQKQKEYWCNVGTVVYVWNYGNNTNYAFKNISASCFLVIDGIIYYGSAGTIEKFTGYSDNGVAVVPQMVTGHNSFGGINFIKSSDKLYVGLLPATYTSLNVYFRTNKRTDWKKLTKQAYYALLDFNNIDFNNYTFKTNRNPQTFALNFSSNDYTTIQFMLENDAISEPCTVLDFLVGANIQGNV